jgi:hypothetical protein
MSENASNDISLFRGRLSCRYRIEKPLGTDIIRVRALLACSTPQPKIFVHTVEPMMGVRIMGEELYSRVWHRTSHIANYERRSRHGSGDPVGAYKAPLDLAARSNSFHHLSYHYSKTKLAGKP